MENIPEKNSNAVIKISQMLWVKKAKRGKKPETALKKFNERLS